MKKLILASALLAIPIILNAQMKSEGGKSSEESFAQSSPIQGVAVNDDKNESLSTSKSSAVVAEAPFSPLPTKLSGVSLNAKPPKQCNAGENTGHGVKARFDEINCVLTIKGRKVMMVKGLFNPKVIGETTSFEDLVTASSQKYGMPERKSYGADDCDPFTSDAELNKSAQTLAMAGMASSAQYECAIWESTTTKMTLYSSERTIYIPGLGESTSHRFAQVLVDKALLIKNDEDLETERANQAAKELKLRQDNAKKALE